MMIRSMMVCGVAIALVGACSPGAASPNVAAAAPYSTCGGQGGDAAQRSPTFFEKMSACGPDAAGAADKLASTTDHGALSEKGDCNFGGISCHVHGSMEFVHDSKLKDDGVGELHCIVPSSDAASPFVFGVHVQCKASAPAASSAQCPSALLQTFASSNCQSGWSCCDDGTLTKPVSKQSDAEKALHPDFRICKQDAVEVDCSIFTGMELHTANVVGLGQTYEGTFKGAH